jgi:hypothetical protein
LRFLGYKSILIFIFSTILLISLTNVVVFKVLKVIADDNVLYFKLPVRNITLIYKHSYLLTEVREVYEVRNDQVCVKEVVWPIGGAGAPASVKDLEYLNGIVEVRGGNYVVTNAKYCLGGGFTLDTEFMIDWKLIIDGYEVRSSKEVELDIVEVSWVQYLLARLGVYMSLLYK